jgi:hypothetical protein
MAQVVAVALGWVVLLEDLLVQEGVSNLSHLSNGCKSRVCHSLDLLAAPNLQAAVEGHLSMLHSMVVQKRLALAQELHIQDDSKVPHRGQELHILVGRMVNIVDHHLCHLELAHNLEVDRHNREEGRHNLEVDRHNLEEDHTQVVRHIQVVRRILAVVRHILVVLHIQGVRHILEVVRQDILVAVRHNLEVHHNLVAALHSLVALHTLGEVRHILGVHQDVLLLVVAR